MDAPACAVPGRPARLGRQADGHPEALAGRPARDAGAVRRQGLPARHVRAVVARGGGRAADAQARARLPGLAADAAARRAPSRRRRTQVAVVRRPTAWLHRTAALDGRVLELSYGTRLPVLSSTDEAVEVARPEGGSAYLRRDGGRPARAGHAVAGAQRRAAGGRGAPLPRSAVPVGRHVRLRPRLLRLHSPRLQGPRRDHPEGRRRPGDRRHEGRHSRRLRAGDLVFFRNESGIHHVGLFVGDGKMIHAPATGHAVTIVSLDTEPYRSEFAGGRRLTP